MKKIWTILTVGTLMLGLPLTLISCTKNDNLYPEQKNTLALAVQKVTNTVKTYQEIEIDKNKVTLTEGKIYAVNTIYNVLGGDNNIYGVTPQNIKITTVLDRDGQILDDHSFSVGIVFEVKYDINNSFEFLTNQSFWLSLKYLTPDEIIKNNLVFTVSSAFQITKNSMLGIGSQGAIAIEKTPTGYQTTDQELLQWDCDTVNHQNLLQLGRMIFPKNINKIPNNTMRINVIQHYPNNRQLYMVTQAVNNGQLAQPKYKAIKVQGNDQWDLLTVALIQVIEIRNKLYVAVINPATENLDPILFNLQYDGSDWMLDLTAPIFLNLKQGFIPGEEYLATNSLFAVKGVTYVMTTLGNLYQIDYLNQTFLLKKILNEKETTNNIHSYIIDEQNNKMFRINHDQLEEVNNIY
ncbi:hypothetical protein S100390_v1c05790 [Spiroplasma sp. NBRC 100390]|uniref:hypothetical protein n=1 Tax=unclassified Spiroplasma TaxID=2637901 RepID=UPI0008928E27|nr:MULTISPECIES: hypothetical protein [unclassified Spiroplasma]AOX43916.1 hypothetical protein STU14_v1c05790 [Spiroplasma sp. TU-14]APE13386.1 hypothetical protein S100390_v1c05790 [Spiroplasma sp. NBRC 100390]